MAKATEIYIVRKMSTPLIINLVPAHLPEPVRAALEQLAALRSELADAERDLAGAKGEAWVTANERLTEARSAADKALEDFGKVNGDSSTALKDSAVSAFTRAMGAANEHIQAALDALKDADQAAALFHSVTPGKPVLRLETRPALESPVHKLLGVVRSDLRDVHSLLPDSVD